MIPETHYAKTPDGVYIAYQTIGDGPIDIVWQFEWIGNVDTIWQYPGVRRMAPQPGIVLAADPSRSARYRGLQPKRRPSRPRDARRGLKVVLDAVGSERPVLGGALEGGAPNVLFAATLPERVHSLFWWYPAPRTIVAPDYPFGAIAETHRARSRKTPPSHWGTDAYNFGELTTFSAFGGRAGSMGLAQLDRRRPRMWPWRLDRIYNETDVRGAMPAITVAGAPPRPRTATATRLTYLASLLRQPQVRLFPGEDCAQDRTSSPPSSTRSGSSSASRRSRPELDTILSTVLFTDVVGSTQKQAAMGDRRWKGVIEQHHAIVRDALGRWRGLESDTAGDGFYATFDGPARAIRCALEIGDRVSATSGSRSAPACTPASAS